MKSEILNSHLNVADADSLYQEFQMKSPTFSSPQEALLNYTRELQQIAESRKTSIEELIQSAENSVLRTEEQRRVMKLANWIAVL